MAKVTTKFQREVHKLGDVPEGAFFQIVDSRWEKIQGDRLYCIYDETRQLSTSDDVMVMTSSNARIRYFSFVSLASPIYRCWWMGYSDEELGSLEVVVLPKGAIITIEV